MKFTVFHFKISQSSESYITIDTNCYVIKLLFVNVYSDPFFQTVTKIPKVQSWIF